MTEGNPSGRAKAKGGDGHTAAVRRQQPRLRVELISVERIRPEEGLDRKRDREGHRELCRSIQQFGVLTPITVRRAPDGSDEYLLVKGQGRTLACRLLHLDKIPAVIVADEFADDEKVQQFLVENVARLRMRPIDRALLVARARGVGEETSAVAARFGGHRAHRSTSGISTRGRRPRRGGGAAGGHSQPGAARGHRPVRRLRRTSRGDTARQ